MCENAYLSNKNPKASRALKWALDPGHRLLASLARLHFAKSANFGLRSWAPPWPNPGSAPEYNTPKMTMYSGILQWKKTIYRIRVFTCQLKKTYRKWHPPDKMHKRVGRRLCCFEKEEKERGQVSVLNPPGNIDNRWRLVFHIHSIAKHVASYPKSEDS